MPFHTGINDRLLFQDWMFEHDDKYAKVSWPVSYAEVGITKVAAKKFTLQISLSLRIVFFGK